jgi:hypothetical protein
MSNQNNCQNHREDITALVLGELESKAAENLKRHIDTCQTCQVLYKALAGEEQMIRSTFETIAEKGEVVKSSLIEQFSKQEPAKSQAKVSTVQIVWGRMLKSPLTKIAAAVIVIIAAILFLNNRSVNFSNSVYAQMLENMQKMTWLHITIKDTFEGKEAQKERWFSDDLQIIAIKETDDRLLYSDYKKGKKYIYDPNSQKISISFIGQKDYQNIIKSVLGDNETLLSKLDEQGALVHKSGEFEGKRVEIYEFQSNIEKNILYIDLPSRLLIYQVTDALGKWGSQNIRYEYPSTGPRNIYDIGAPVTAKAPAQDLQDVMEKYLSYWKSSPQRYTAIVTMEQWNKQIQYLDIIYKDGKNQRNETHTTDDQKQQWAEYPKQTNVAFSELLELANKGGKEYVSIRLYANIYGQTFWLTKSQNQPLQILRFSGTNPLDRTDLACLGWPLYRDMQNDGAIIENEYSIKNNLICMQELYQGMRDGQRAIKPSKYLYYFNPSRDYICERIELYYLTNASWQKDKSWIEGVDLNILGPDSSTITEVKEYRQTELGQWYPYKIETSISVYDVNINAFGPYSFNNVKTVYLNTNPIFPKGIFDPNQLPK